MTGLARKASPAAGRFGLAAGARAEPDWPHCFERPDRPITVQAAGGEVHLNATMAPLGGYKDEEVAAVLTYVRQQWGNKGSKITPRRSRPSGPPSRVISPRSRR